jgi:heparan-alpha-glucosaminide N-acetyltransferase
MAQTSVSETTPGPPFGDAAGRIGSVDALRGLVITVMIFVNDLADAPRAPIWLKHVGINADAMRLPDVVFPAFLFLAGVSIPLAFGRALARDPSRWQLLGKVVTRTLALLVMGVVMVNMEEHEPWAHGLWGVLAYVAMFLAFAVVPGEAGRARALFRIGRVVGAVGLVALVLTYRTADGRMMILGPLFDPADTVWLRHSWWGILGLIGWAYLVGSLVYLAVGHRREWLVGATGGLVLLYVAAEANLPAQLASRLWLAWAMPALTVLEMGFGWVNSQVGIGGTLGSLASITVAGCCLGSVLADNSEFRQPAQRARWALAFALGLFLVGVLLDAPYGINKIRATPSWCLFCAAITSAAWGFLCWLMDSRGHRGWSRVFSPAGANPLLAYLLHPFVGFLVALAGQRALSIVFFYRDPGLPAIVAVAGSLAMAFAVVQATGWIARAGYRLKV